MGIGLTLIKELVEMMGGTIGWTSPEDAGSTFWIELGIGCPIVDSREGSTSVTGRKG
jgi:signal transduction histidine kinase